MTTDLHMIIYSCVNRCCFLNGFLQLSFIMQEKRDFTKIFTIKLVKLVKLVKPVKSVISERRGMSQVIALEHQRADSHATISEDSLCDLAEVFKVFGDSTRIKILYDLFEGEKNVTEICQDLEMNQSAISHQLKILRTARLVSGKRVGKSILYSLADEHVKTIIAMGIEHIEE